jgi:hypothetical protein
MNDCGAVKSPETRLLSQKTLLGQRR